MARHVRAVQLDRRRPTNTSPARIVALPVTPEAETMAYGDYLYDEWLPALKADAEPTTYYACLKNIDNHIAPMLGDVAVSALTNRMLKEFYQELLRTTWVRSETRLLSKGSVTRIHAVVGWSLESLVEAGRLPANPAWGARPRLKKSERYEPVTWTPEQVCDFLEYSRDDWQGALWNLLALTGMRRGEALGLRWFDLSRGYTHVSVRRALAQVNRSVYVTAPKSGQGRRVDLLTSTASALRSHRATEVRRRKREGLPALQPNDFIFCRGAGEWVIPANVSVRFPQFAVAAGFPRIRLHDLRHTHASHLLQAGANIKAVQERLGHANPMFTIDTYIHMMPTIQAEAVKALTRFYLGLGRHEQRGRAAR